MARSAYIYLVTISTDDLPTAAFTVKHEMESWLTRSGLENPVLWRCRDGGGGVPERMELDPPRTT